MRRIMFLLPGLLALWAPAAQAQGSQPPSSIDGVINRLYQLISGPQGKVDTAAIRQLFLPGARLVALNRFQQFENTYPQAVSMSLNDFLTSVATNHQQRAFYEVELGRRTEVFNSLASVWSPYAIYVGDDKSLLRRGINTYTLVQHNGNWRIAHVAWDTETDTRKLPEEDLFPEPKR